MLERATACLKAGARDSLKCAQNGPRSKRILHSSFWAHGAGGLDLSPWTLSMLPSPNDLPLKLDNNDPEQSAASISSAPAQDGVFLDFLYPPQALAWLHGASGQSWERWERRNVRRLPEGFIQAPRGYSVRSYGKSAAAAASRQERVRDPLEGVQGVSGKGVFASDDDVRATEEQDQAETEQERAVKALIKTEPSDLQNETVKAQEDGFADTPADLAEFGVDDHLQDPLKALRDLVAGRRGTRGADPTNLAWSLYNALKDDDKEDAHLKSWLLAYFASKGNDVADAHCIALYYAIPLKERQLAIYQATVRAFLRRNDIDFALGLHTEALRNIANGHQVSKELFKYAAEHRMWKVALQVQNQHHEAFEEAGQQNQLEIFWLGVSEMSNLTEACVRLYSKIHWWHMKRNQGLAPYGLLCARMSEEALWQFLQAPLPLKYLKRLHYLVDAIRRWHPKANKILEEALTSLLERLNTQDEYARAHYFVSNLYQSYRKTRAAQAPEWMLMALLQKVVRFASSMRELRKTTHSISVNVLVTHWKNDYGELSAPAVYELMAFYASMGVPAKVQQWFGYLRRHYPEYTHHKDTLWALIYVHARRADIGNAVRAFNDIEEICKSNNDTVPDKCWNTLLHAHSRADNLDGALTTFQNLLDAGVKPTAYQMQPIAEMLARRGDVEGVEDVLQQFDALVQEKRTTPLISSYVQALVNSGNLEKATQVLRDTLAQVKAGKVLGSLTTSFNILITAHALRRDMDETMNVYRWMQAAKTRMNTYTYSALMQALIHLRQTNGAKKILFTVLPRLGLRPTALHYAIVVAGYTNQGMYQDALLVYAKMLHRNVRPSLATHRTYLRAKALYEQKYISPTIEEDEPAPLPEVMSALWEAVESRDGSDIAPKGPGFGYASFDRGQAVAAYIDSVMYIHGTRRCLEAVSEMFRLYRGEETQQTQEPPPMRILTALMNTLLHAGEYEQVEVYWNLAKQQADLIAPSQPIPDFTPGPSVSKAKVEQPLASQATSLSPSNEIDRAEIGFASGEEAKAVEESQVLPAQSTSTTILGPRPAPARRYILSNAFRHYIASLAKEYRVVDMVALCTKLLSQGYALDNHTWNRLIIHLCTATPPLVLLAFTLTERFLMPLFPGWVKMSRTKFRARRPARAQHLEYLRASYLRSDQLMPQYETMVHLGAAYIKLRRAEAFRGTQRRRDRDDVQRLVGTVRLIRERAPRALRAVQDMPRVNDSLQHRLLVSQD